MVSCAGRWSCSEPRESCPCALRIQERCLSHRVPCGTPLSHAAPLQGRVSVLSAVCHSHTMSDEKRCAQRLDLPEPLSTRHGLGSVGLPLLGLDIHHHIVYGGPINQREASSVALTRCWPEGDGCTLCSVEHSEGLLRVPRSAARRRWHAWARQTVYGLGLLTRLTMTHRLPARGVSTAAPARRA